MPTTEIGIRTEIYFGRNAQTGNNPV